MAYLSGACDGEVRVWDLAHRKCLWHNYAHKNFVTGLVVAPDGRSFFSCGDDNLVKQWALQAGVAPDSDDDDDAGAAAAGAGAAHGAGGGAGAGAAKAQVKMVMVVGVVCVTVWVAHQWLVWIRLRMEVMELLLRYTRSGVSCPHTHTQLFTVWVSPRTCMCHSHSH